MAKVLYERQRITSVNQLEKLAREGNLRGLPGIQAKTEQNILKGIRLVRAGQERMPLGRALPLGRELVHALERLAGVKEVSLAGSIRRMKDTVGDIDILVTSAKPDAVIRSFVALPQVGSVLERGSTKSSIRHREGIQVDLRVVAPESFGAALAYFTGSKQHNIHLRKMALQKGLKISEYGVFRVSSGRRIAGATEEEVYATVGLPWIAPELREDAGEIDAALKGKLPRLLELKDIRGDLHCHTNATRRPPHHRGAGHGGRTPRLRVRGRHRPQRRHARGRRPHRRGAGRARQADPRRPGPASPDHRARRVRMRHPPRRLARLPRDRPRAARPGDRARCMRRLTQSKAEMTRRVCRALAHPRLHVLAHPTGRLIGKREPSRSISKQCSGRPVATTRRSRSTPTQSGWTSMTCTPGGSTTSAGSWRSPPTPMSSMISPAWSWASPRPGADGRRSATS